jgi:hypothetical protein
MLYEMMTKNKSPKIREFLVIPLIRFTERARVDLWCIFEKRKLLYNI